ncbi:integrase domain-containing protein [Legionella pneumophila]|uniref:phage integrase N-terminal domain-containing protein n=1 Tax=Legionella pneumophila TaxID=446 RepID=UPI0024B725DB|nr:phage integrase N-terminal domain-containing protein [Legionella pneumophila]MDI9824507.1 integrase domain-containing protein [Legionella pneumophila]
MSNNKLRSAKFSINEMVKEIKRYSHASRADMRVMLNRSIKDLHEKGYKISHIKGLKPKHIFVLVEHWKEQGKSPATIKNYMSKLRETAKFLDKPQLVKPSNDDYQIPKRSHVTTVNKAIHELDLSKCRDPLVRLSLEAQSLFGLRREESMKIVLSDAFQGNYLQIKPSWTKGGIGRTLWITNDAQRQWLNKALQEVPAGHSLIPQDRTYKQHLRHYQSQTELMGIHKLHGLRHAFAQRQYFELTKQFDPNGKGWQSPINGGPPRKQLNQQEKQIDRKVRGIISRQLGHSRISILKIYCG